MDGKIHINLLIGALVVLLLGTSLFPNSLQSITYFADLKSQLVVKKTDFNSNTSKLPCEKNEQEEERDFETKSFLFDVHSHQSAYSSYLADAAVPARHARPYRVAPSVPIYLVTHSLII